jgi:hypothetical protein
VEDFAMDLQEPPAQRGGSVEQGKDEKVNEAGHNINGTGQASKNELPQPCRDTISAHLHALFASNFVHPYPDAWFEIAFSHPSDGQIREAQDYSVFDLKAAAEFAAAKSKAGSNIYVSPALRHGKQPRSGRASAEHFLASAFAWSDHDKLGDKERIDAILREFGLHPTIVVTTGTIPHWRAQLCFNVGTTTDPRTAEGDQ